MDSTAHVRRIVVLLVVAAVAGLVLQRLLRPPTFGDVGHYRAASLGEIMALPVVYQGEAVCSECHSEINDLHEKDVHYGVPCEDCHGRGDRHVQYYRKSDSALAEADAAVPKEYTLEGCLYCHRKLAAKPRDFPQVELAQHYSFLHVTDPETPCVECHSPHEPLFLLTRAEDARIHPIIHECSDCHEEQPEGDHRGVPLHPAIFTCGDCHPEVVEDFADREHGFLRCTACHLFHKENENAGRIYKNGNRRFCLLCHEERPFKAEGEVPMIVSAEHLGDMAEFQQKDPAELEKDPRACLGCHFEYIHGEEVVPTQGGSDEE